MIECSGFAALSDNLEYFKNYVSIFLMQYIKLKGIIYSLIGTITFYVQIRIFENILFLINFSMQNN